MIYLYLVRGFLKSKKFIFLAILIIITFFQLLLTDNKNSTSPAETKPSPEKAIKMQPDEEEVEDIEDESVLGSESEKHPANRVSARVIGVRDGDTIEVDIGGSKKVVRYIGVDTPESVDPRRAVECFGKEASNINRSLVENQIVQLEKDVSETDKYGRLLRYVYLGDIFVNRYLVEEGFANASAYPPDIKYQEDLESSEEEARINNKGLWGTCGSSLNSQPRSTSTKSSNDKDCSDFATHQEAQDYFTSKGGSSTNNVDKLDGADHDGLVCETLP